MNLSIFDKFLIFLLSNSVAQENGNVLVTKIKK